MSELVTFGDLIDSARGHLAQVAAIPGRPAEVGRDLPDLRVGMYALVTEIGRCIPDGNQLMGSPADEHPVSARPETPAPWLAACRQAKRSAGRAARLLSPPLVTARRRTAPATERGRHLVAAARALSASRDLLATHVGTDPDGGPVELSAWAPVVSAPVISRAQAAEVAALAQQTAALGTGLVMTTPASWAETNQAKQDLAGACGYLRLAAGAIAAAHRQDPVLADDQALLRAIPSAIPPPRRLPKQQDSVTALCQGIVVAAERLRLSAVVAARKTWSSPDLSADSLRQAAAAAVVTSHNCAVLFRTLGEHGEEMDAETGPAGSAEDTWSLFGPKVALSEADRAAGAARDRWLRVCRTLDSVTTEMRDQMSPPVADARDLALWTGRLAYADPRWTPASGPRARVREPVALAAGWDDVAVAVAAAHHASNALTHLARAHERQARSAARAGRFLEPAGAQTLRDPADRRPQPAHASQTYAAASPERIAVVLSIYRQVGEASAEAEEQIATAAEALQAPSLVLRRARELESGSAPDAQQDDRPRARLAGAASYEPDHVPGPVERSLQMLGVVDPEWVRHALDVDRVGEQVIAAAAGRHTFPVAPSVRPAVTDHEQSGRTGDPSGNFDGSPGNQSMQRISQSQRQAE
jgi:hypothetical protein